MMVITMTKKVFLFFCFFLCIIAVTASVAYADNITLYSSIDDSSSQANLLTDIMRNDRNYDPFNEYAIVRAGERDYRIYFGKNLDENELTMIQYIPAYQLQAAQINRSINKSLSVQKNGFYYCSSREGSPGSKLVDDYKLGVIITGCAIIILVLFIFRIFRKSDHKKAKFYNVR